MKASKLLVSSVAALSVVGAIGFASAQSTAPGVTQPDGQTRPLDRNANTNNTLPGTNPSGSAMNNNMPSTSDRTLQRNADLPPQADRN